MSTSTRVHVEAHAGAVVLRVALCVDGGRVVLKQIQAPLTTAQARALVVDITRAIEEAECPSAPRAASSAKNR